MDLLGQAAGGLDDRLLRGEHEVLVEGGVDLVTTGLDIGARQPLGLQLLERLGQHVAAEPAERLGVLARVRLRELQRGREVAVLLGVQLRHLPEDVVEAELGAGVVLLLLGDVEVARLLDASGEVGALGLGQFLDAVTEELLSGSLDAIGVATEGDGVQVVLENLLLVPVLVQLDRDEDLLDLPLDRYLLAEALEVVPGHLLGDRGGALELCSGRGAPCRPRDAGQRDAGVGPERVVLGRDHRVLDVLRHVVELDGLALGAQAGHRRAVRVVEGAGLGGRGLLGILFARQRGVGVGDGDHAEDAGRQDGEADHHDLPVGDEPPPARAAGRLVVPHAPPAGAITGRPVTRAHATGPTGTAWPTGTARTALCPAASPAAHVTAHDGLRAGDVAPGRALAGRGQLPYGLGVLEGRL